MTHGDVAVGLVAFGFGPGPPRRCRVSNPVTSVIMRSDECSGCDRFVNTDTGQSLRATWVQLGERAAAGNPARYELEAVNIVLCRH
jgi:hypothetical protein